MATRPHRARDAATEGAQRAEVIGGGVGEELETASDRTGRRIHSFTEQAARPLDQASDQLLHQVGRISHALNPVRVTGRTVGATAAAVLHLGSVVFTRAPRTARRTLQR